MISSKVENSCQKSRFLFHVAVTKTHFYTRRNTLIFSFFFLLSAGCLQVNNCTAALDVATGEAILQKNLHILLIGVPSTELKQSEPEILPSLCLGSVYQYFLFPSGERPCPGLCGSRGIRAALTPKANGGERAHCAFTLPGAYR